MAEVSNVKTLLDCALGDPARRKFWLPDGRVASARHVNVFIDGVRQAGVQSVHLEDRPRGLADPKRVLSLAARLPKDDVDADARHPVISLAGAAPVQVRVEVADPGTGEPAVEWSLSPGQIVERGGPDFTIYQVEALTPELTPSRCLPVSGQGVQAEVPTVVLADGEFHHPGGCSVVKGLAMPFTQAVELGAKACSRCIPQDET